MIENTDRQMMPFFKTGYLHSLKGKALHVQRREMVEDGISLQTKGRGNRYAPSQYVQILPRETPLQDNLQ